MLETDARCDAARGVFPTAPPHTPPTPHTPPPPQAAFRLACNAARSPDLSRSRSRGVGAFDVDTPNEQRPVGVGARAEGEADEARKLTSGMDEGPQAPSKSRGNKQKQKQVIHRIQKKSSERRKRDREDRDLRKTNKRSKTQ